MINKLLFLTLLFCLVGGPWTSSLVLAEATPTPSDYLKFNSEPGDTIFMVTRFAQIGNEHIATPLVTLKADGTFIIDKSVPIDEAAKKFIQIVKESWPQMCGCKK